MSQTNPEPSFFAGQTPLDLDALSDRVMRRDRRRMLLLGIACVIAWMMVIMLPWATILPMLAKVVEHQNEIARVAAPATPEEQARSMEVLKIVKTGTMATFAGSIASMFLAAICTVSLILLSRRATLRQTNLRLQQLSVQIRSLPGMK